MRIKPSLVVLFDQTEEESMARLGNRRMDPNSGKMYNLDVNPPADLTSKLVEAKMDGPEVVKKLYAEWADKCSKLKDAYKNCHQTVHSDRSQVQLSEALADLVQNPM